MKRRRSRTRPCRFPDMEIDLAMRELARSRAVGGRIHGEAVDMGAAIPMADRGGVDVPHDQMADGSGSPDSPLLSGADTPPPEGASPESPPWLKDQLTSGAGVRYPCQASDPLFPFPSKTVGKLFWWLETASASLSREDRRTLLKLLQDPDFKTVDLRDQSLDSIIAFRSFFPQKKPEKIVCKQKLVFHQKKHELTGESSVRTTIKNTHIDYYSLVEVINRTLHDPVYKKHSDRGGPRVPTGIGVREFNESNMARNARLYAGSQPLTLVLRDVLYRVGDIVQANPDGVRALYRIERLFHRASEKNEIQMWASLSCCEQDEEELVHQPDSLVEATVDSILEKDDSRCGIARKEGELVPYQPLEVSTTHQHFITDRRSIWYDIYMDAFKQDNYRSMTGVYVRIASLQGMHRTRSENIKVLMMIPHGVDLDEALVLLRRDIEFLHRNGYPINRGGPVRCTPSCFPADLIQKYKNCRHKGNRACRNCPHCLIWNYQRLQPLDLSSTNTRSMAHTETAVELANAAPNTKAKQAIEKRLGINAVPSPLGTVVDVNMRSPPCSGHMIKYGIMKRLTKCTWYYLDTSQRKLLGPRMQSFSYPRGMAVVTFDVSKRVGRNISMKYYRKLMVIWPLILSDLLDHRSAIWRCLLLLCEVDHLIYTYWQHRNKLLTVLKTRKLVRMLAGLKAPNRNMTKFPKFDIPNTHHLLELVERFLPLYENVEFFDTTSLEACHKLPKNLVRATRYYSDRHNDVAAMVNRRDCMGYVFRGGTWGPSHCLKLGEYWSQLRDPKRPTRPHRIVRRATSYGHHHEPSDAIARVSCGGWRVRVGNKVKKVPNPPDGLSSKSRAILHTTSRIDTAAVSEICNQTHCRESALCVGDDIYYGPEAGLYAHVTGIYRVRVQAGNGERESILLSVKTWVPKKGLPVVPMALNVKSSTLTTYISSEHVGGQILVAHSCNVNARVGRCALDENGRFVHNYTNRNYRLRQVGLVLDNERLSPNWHMKTRKNPPNPLDRCKKFQTRTGTLKDVRAGKFVVLLHEGEEGQGTRVGLVKVVATHKNRRTVRWWGGEDVQESLLGKMVGLSVNRQPWHQMFEDTNAIVAANFELENGMLPNEVLALIDWDWRTAWNLSTEFGDDDRFAVDMTGVREDSSSGECSDFSTGEDSEFSSSEESDFSSSEDSESTEADG